MDLSQYLKNGADAPAAAGQQLSKEEYAAMKKQEREEVWAEVDSKAQEVFQDGESLKKFLDFMARCKPQKAANLLLLYGQNPEIRQVKTFDGWKREHKALRAGAHGYTFIADQKYEQEFMPDEFVVSGGMEMKGDVQPPETQKAEGRAGKGQKQKGGKSKKQAER